MSAFDIDDIQFVDNTPEEAAEAKRAIVAELSRLQAIEAAARRVLTDGHSEYYMELRDHDETLNALAAALRQPGPGEGGG